MAAGGAAPLGATTEEEAVAAGGAANNLIMKFNETYLITMYIFFVYLEGLI